MRTKSVFVDTHLQQFTRRSNSSGQIETLVSPWHQPSHRDERWDPSASNHRLTSCIYPQAILQGKRSPRFFPTECVRFLCFFLAICCKENYVCSACRSQGETRLRAVAHLGCLIPLKAIIVAVLSSTNRLHDLDVRRTMLNTVSLAQ